MATQNAKQGPLIPGGVFVVQSNDLAKMWGLIDPTPEQTKEYDDLANRIQKKTILMKLKDYMNKLIIKKCQMIVYIKNFVTHIGICFIFICIQMEI